VRLEAGINSVFVGVDAAVMGDQLPEVAGTELAADGRFPGHRPHARSRVVGAEGTFERWGIRPIFADAADLCKT
jgi:hypothetical protein